MPSNQDAYNQLSYYTLNLGDADFIHQHVVDAFAAQTADESSKSIKIVFALIGLYLHVEKQFTGLQVQRSHRLMARKKRAWPVIPLPTERGTVTACHVLANPAGSQREEAIHQWCANVWAAFLDSRQLIADLASEYGIE